MGSGVCGLSAGGRVRPRCSASGSLAPCAPALERRAELLPGCLGSTQTRSAGMHQSSPPGRLADPGRVSALSRRRPGGGRRLQAARGQLACRFPACTARTWDPRGSGRGALGLNCPPGPQQPLNAHLPCEHLPHTSAQISWTRGSPARRRICTELPGSRRAKKCRALGAVVRAGRAAPAPGGPGSAP